MKNINTTLFQLIQHGLIVLLLSLFTSCEKEIKFNGNIEPSKLVVNCIFENNRPITLKLSSSKSTMIGKKADGVQNATVELIDSETNNTIEKLTPTNELGLFTSVLIPDLNIKYHLRVTHPKYSTITAFGHCPDTVKNVTTSIINESKSNNNLKININFQDLFLEDENYYLIYFESIKNDFEIYADRLPITTNNPNIENKDTFFGDSDDTNYDYILIRDTNFENNLVNINLDVLHTKYSPSKNSSDSEKIVLKIVNCSYSAYQYIKTFHKFTESGNTPFTQPVQVYTNIDNGLGIFAGTSVKSIIIKF